MSRSQRLGYLGVAVAIAVAAIVIFSVGSGPDETAEDSASPAAQETATATATADGEQTATPEPTPTPKPQPPLLQAGRERTLSFTEGETVRFRVRSDVDEEIHVHGYDRYVDVPAGKTVNVSFEGDITGIFEIELHGSGEQIASLKVEPG